MTDPLPAGGGSPKMTATGASRLRLDIQGLRALAVLLVLIDHLGARWLSGGFVGVDVFFVLSGFLITGLLKGELERTGRVSLVGFYARRARRILPAATVVLVAVAAYSAWQLSVVQSDRNATDVRWSAAFLANIHFSRIGTDYFSEGLPPSPVQHFWSLAVEEQFYLVWPAAILVVALLLRRATSRRRVTWVALLAVLAWCASLAWSVLDTPENGTSAYFSSLTRAWELATGALLALGIGVFRHLGPRARTVLALAGLTAIAVAAVQYDAHTPFPGYHALLPVLGTSAVLVAGAEGPTPLPSRVLGWWPFARIGDLSYSLYLWHWPVIVLARGRTGPHPSLLEALALAVVSLVLSVLSYHLIENPIRFNRRLSTPVRRGLVLWPLALVLTFSAAWASPQWAEHQLYARRSNSPYVSQWKQPEPLPTKLQLSEEMARKHAPIPTDIKGFDDLLHGRPDLWQRDFPCVAAHDAGRLSRICPAGAVDAKHTMVVLGDSHIGMWLPAFDDYARAHDIRLIPLVKYGCAPFDVEISTNGGTRVYTECNDFRAWAIGQIEKLAPDVLVIGSRGLQRNMTAPPAQRPAAWSAGVISLLDAVRPLAGRTVVVSDISPLASDPAACLTDPSATMATCSSAFEPRVREANRITEQAAKQAHTPYLDLTPLVCTSVCTAVADQLIVYGNVDHISRAWAHHVVPEFTRRLDRALGTS